MVQWYRLGQLRRGKETGGVPTAVRRISPRGLTVVAVMPRSPKNRRCTAITSLIRIREERVEAKAKKVGRRVKEKAPAKGKSKPMRHQQNRMICGPTAGKRRTMPWGRGMKREGIDEVEREIRRCRGIRHGAEEISDHRARGRANRRNKPGQTYRTNSPRRVELRR